MSNPSNVPIGISYQLVHSSVVVLFSASDLLHPMTESPLLVLTRILYELGSSNAHQRFQL